MSNILDRRQTHFVLWCPTEPANAPALVIGRIRNGNPATFQELTRQTLQRAANAAGPIAGLWHLAANSLGLTDGETYHYWYEVDNTYPGSTGRIQVTDPLASGVDYRLLAPANWDFVRDFTTATRSQFQDRYPAEGSSADAKVLVVGEELTLPRELLSGSRLDGLWNERFQGFVRAALLGEGAHGHNFEDTVHHAINCVLDGVFTDGAQAIN
jgi:hypothetical protein